MGVTRVVAIILALAAAVAGAYALFQAFDNRSAPPIIIQDASADQPVVVDVRGALNAPGVVTLPPGARVQDAIAAAGGLASSADLSTINLARRLRDGEVIVIAELPGTSTSQAPQATGDASQTSEVGQERLNVNIATVSELELLPEIGEVTAERIVRYREEHGPYRSVDDLIHVEGISARTIDGFRDLVTVGP